MQDDFVVVILRERTDKYITSEATFTYYISGVSAELFHGGFSSWRTCIVGDVGSKLAHAALKKLTRKEQKRQREGQKSTS